MTPAEELKTLRYNETVVGPTTIPADGEIPVAFKAVEDNVMELETELRSQGAEEWGVNVCCSPNGREQTTIGYSRSEGNLRIDTTRTGLNQRNRSIEAAPLKLAPGETVKLRVFVDRSIVEVFANDGRLALSRRVYPSRGSTGIRLYTKGGAAQASALGVWDLMPTNPY